VALLLTGGLLVAACGGRSASPGVASLGSTTTTAAAPASASPTPFAGVQQEYNYVLSYAECMRSHGVTDFPDPTPPSNHGFGFNPAADSHAPQFASANSACKHFLPDNGGPLTPAQVAIATAMLLKYSKCMRSHHEPGFPDPTVNSNEMGFSLRGINPRSPQFQAAQTACKSFLPGGGP